MCSKDFYIFKKCLQRTLYNVIKSSKLCQQHERPALLWTCWLLLRYSDRGNLVLTVECASYCIYPAALKPWQPFFRPDFLTPDWNWPNRESCSCIWCWFHDGWLRLCWSSSVACSPLGVFVSVFGCPGGCSLGSAVLHWVCQESSWMPRWSTLLKTLITQGDWFKVNEWIDVDLDIYMWCSRSARHFYLCTTSGL